MVFWMIQCKNSVWQKNISRKCLELVKKKKLETFDSQFTDSGISSHLSQAAYVYINIEHIQVSMV